ncbi:hypothetical protein M3J09_000565 [Ascochyta lentis]
MPYTSAVNCIRSLPTSSNLPKTSNLASTLKLDGIPTSPN